MKNGCHVLPSQAADSHRGVSETGSKHIWGGLGLRQWEMQSSVYACTCSLKLKSFSPALKVVLNLRVHDKWRLTALDSKQLCLWGEEGGQLQLRGCTMGQHRSMLRVGCLLAGEVLPKQKQCQVQQPWFWTTSTYNEGLATSTYKGRDPCWRDVKFLAGDIPNDGWCFTLIKLMQE